MISSSPPLPLSSLIGTVLSFLICSFLRLLQRYLFRSCPVIASAVFALGNLLDMGSTSVNGVDDSDDD